MSHVRTLPDRLGGALHRGRRRALGHVLPGVFQADRRGRGRAGEPAGGGADLAHGHSRCCSRSTSRRCGQVGRHWRGIGVTLLVNWAVKPFSMAALGWLFVGWLFRPYLPAGPGRQLHRRADHPGGGAVHRDGVRVVEPDPKGEPHFTLEPGGAQRHDHGGGLRALSSACCSGCRRSRCPGARWCCRWCSTSSCPVLVAQLVRRRAPGVGRASRRWTGSSPRRSGPASLVALLATLVLLFGFQGEQILAQPLVIALLAVPILIQVYFNSGLAYLLNRARGRAALRGGSLGADRRVELLRAGGGRRHQPVRASTRARRLPRSSAS